MRISESLSSFGVEVEIGFDQGRRSSEFLRDTAVEPRGWDGRQVGISDGRKKEDTRLPERPFAASCPKERTSD